MFYTWFRRHVLYLIPSLMFWCTRQDVEIYFIGSWSVFHEGVYDMI